MKCTACTTDVEKLAIISVFMPGKTEGIQNTQEIAQLCNTCIERLIRREITLDKPKESLSWQNFLQ